MSRPPRLKYLIYLFDADGPLINSVDASFGTTNRVLESFGLEPLDLEAWRQKTKAPRILYRNAGVPERGVEDAIRRYHVFFEELRHTTTSPLEVENTLEALNDKRVGVVTDMSRRGWEEYEIKFQFLQNYVSVVVTRDDCEERKPLPNPLLLAMKELGIDKRKIRAHRVRGLMVGDMPNDITAGRNAGLDTAALFYSGSYSNEERLRKSQPTYLIPSMSVVADPKELARYQINDSLFS